MRLSGRGDVSAEAGRRCRGCCEGRRAFQAEGTACAKVRARERTPSWGVDKLSVWMMEGKAGRNERTG